MSDLRTAAQQALEALERCAIRLPDPEAQDGVLAAQQRHQRIEFVVASAIDALRSALAEPHVWVCPEAADTHRYDKPGHCEDCGKTLIQMAEPVQEPVAIHQWRKSLCAEWYDGHPDHSDGGGPYGTRTLYTAPPQRKPLTDEQIEELNLHYLMTQSAKFTIVRAVERAHGITASAPKEQA